MRLPNMTDLERDQVAALNIPLEESSIVTGPPGSGKTVVAIHRANRAHDSGKGTRLLMYNRVLQRYVKAGVDNLGPSAETSTFHQWFLDFYRKYTHKRPPQYRRYEYKWDEIITNLMKVTINRDTDLDLIVDEGQDLPSEFYLFLEDLAATVTIFADENQRIHKDNSTLEDIRRCSQIKRIINLQSNYRNTQAIANLAGHIQNLTGNILPEGYGDVREIKQNIDTDNNKPILMENVDPEEELIDMILTEEEANTDTDIGVLLNRNSDVKKLAQRLNKAKDESGNSYHKQHPAQYYTFDMKPDDKNTIDWSKNSIKIINYLSAKGTEFDRVFLANLDKVTMDPTEPTTAMLFYTLVTRARNKLYMTYYGEGTPRILDLFPDRLIERQ